MSLDRFCRKPLVTLHPDATAKQAADEMNAKHVGAVLVVDAQAHPVGIVTDRDLVCRVVAQGLDPAKTPVGEVMSASVATIQSNQLIDEAAVQMRELGVRRLPVVERGRAVGMISLDDLLVMLSAELGQITSVIRSNRGP